MPWQGPKWELAVACGSLQSGRADWLVEKCTELGACSFRPVLTQRSPGIGALPSALRNTPSSKHVTRASCLQYMAHLEMVTTTCVCFVCPGSSGQGLQGGKVLAKQAKETWSRGQDALLGGSVLLMQPPSNPSGTYTTAFYKSHPGFCYTCISSELPHSVVYHQHRLVSAMMACLLYLSPCWSLILAKVCVVENTVADAALSCIV